MVSHLQSGGQAQATFPAILNGLSFSHPSAFMLALPFSIFVTLALTMSLPQVHWPGLLDIVVQAHFSPQLQTDNSSPTLRSNFPLDWARENATTATRRTETRTAI